MTSLPLQNRTENLSWMSQSSLDVLVVGGGITGAGIARDAALRGFRVGLVEQRDFASGTSSRSSKLIHGGLRYLAQGDIALVREAARERAVLRALAPHLVRPVRVLVPATSRAGLLKLQAGMWAFKRLAPGDEKFDTRGSEELARLEPLMHERTFAGAVSYVEYMTDDARLTLETVQGAAAAGARVANYAGAVAIELQPTRATVTIVDELRNETVVVGARCLVNASGPWLDRVSALSEPNATNRLRLTRGIHVSLPRPCLDVRHLIVLRALDGRSVFAVPSGRYSYIGTTDTNYDGDPGEPGVSRDDVRYLLDAVNATFRVAVRGTDIVGTWAGVRPLVHEPGKEPSEISRRDEIRAGPGPVVSIAGGKLTTYRKMAERAVEEVCKLLGSPAPTGKSAEIPLPGGNAELQDGARERTPRLADRALDDRLWSTYGAVAASIIFRIAREPSLGAAAGGLESLTIAEVLHCAEIEMVNTLDDLLRRRSNVAMFDTQAAIVAAPAVAELLGDRLGWSRERRSDEVRRFREKRQTELDVARSA
jgi:glycerol-3-phosphate dehydrogenase